MSKRRLCRIRKLASGRFQARYPGPDGVDRTPPNTFATKKEAEIWLTEISNPGCQPGNSFKIMASGQQAAPLCSRDVFRHPNGQRNPVRRSWRWRDASGRHVDGQSGQSGQHRPVVCRTVTNEVSWERMRRAVARWIASRLRTVTGLTVWTRMRMLASSSTNSIRSRTR